MNYEGLIRVVDEQRRYARVPFKHTARCAYGPGHQAKASCEDVGLGGLRLKLGRYLRPGTLVLVSVGEQAVQLKARVAWCRGLKDHHFAAGLRVFQSEAEAALALTRLSTQAALDSGLDVRLDATPYPKVVTGCGV